ncbi:MAG TPA: FAD-dependent oxidoreductase, partial [Thermoanaerobaculia bacterium]|nr:FAD-dependent oxidoreductase [Thermoanaerobaculia bacterium]
MSSSLPHPEVLIVGGGVMGASTAWHLANRGCRDVLVLDHGPEPGAGSTGRATGGFRTQFATEINIRLSLLSREKLLRFPEEVGADPGYRPSGYLFLAADDTQLETLRALRPLQRSLGVEVEEIGPEDIRRL